MPPVNRTSNGRYYRERCNEPLSSSCTVRLWERDMSAQLTPLLTPISFWSGHHLVISPFVFFANVYRILDFGTSRLCAVRFSTDWKNNWKRLIVFKTVYCALTVTKFLTDQPKKLTFILFNKSMTQRTWSYQELTKLEVEPGSVSIELGKSLYCTCETFKKQTVNCIGRT
jgi:hypothetical protein